MSYKVAQQAFFKGAEFQDWTEREMPKLQERFVAWWLEQKCDGYVVRWDHGPQECLMCWAESGDYSDFHDPFLKSRHQRPE